VVGHHESLPLRRHTLANVTGLDDDVTVTPLLREPDEQHLIVLASHVTLDVTPGEEAQVVSGVLQKEVPEVLVRLVDRRSRRSGQTGGRGAASDQLAVGVEGDPDVSVGIRFDVVVFSGRTKVKGYILLIVGFAY